MLNTTTIIERITHLDETLQWEKDGVVEVWRLYSTDSSRFIVKVERLNDTQTWVVHTRDQYNNNSPVFKDLEKAKEFAKFNAIRDILADNLRTLYVQ